MTLRTPRLLAAGVAGLLGTAAFVGGTMTAANAGTPSAPINYNCSAVGNNLPVQLVYTLPDALTAPATPLQAGQPVPETSGLIVKIEIPADVSKAIGGYGLAGLGGGKPMTGHISIGGVSVAFTAPFNESTPVPADGSAFEMVSDPGTVSAFNPTGAGAENVLPGATDSDLTGLGIDIPCTVDPSSKNTSIGTVNFAGEDTTSKHFSATASGATIKVKASVGSGDGATAGTGAVTASGKVKVASGKKTVTKAVTGKATLKNGAASIKLKLPKGTKKGSYKFTVSWSGSKTTVTVKVK